MIITIFGWLIFSIIIGIIGSNRKIGFVSALFLSIILSPLIGLIITLTSKSIETEKYEIEILETQKKQQKTLENISKKTISNITDDLKKIKELLDNGIINQEEFDKMKNQLINSIDEPSIFITESEEDIDNNKKTSKDEFEKTWITYSIGQGTLEIEIYKINKFPYLGDSVNLNGKPAADGEYKIGIFTVIKVQNGKVCD